jgi:hypothetical protein
MGKRRVQVVVTLMPGAENWFRVTHEKGFFALPGDARVDELFAGAAEAWTTRHRARTSDTMIRVSLAEWTELNANRGRSGTGRS